MFVWLPSSCSFHEEKEPSALLKGCIDLRTDPDTVWISVSMLEITPQCPACSLSLTGPSQFITCNIRWLKVGGWRADLLAVSNVSKLKEKASVYEWDAALFSIQRVTQHSITEFRANCWAVQSQQSCHLCGLQDWDCW